MNKPLLISQASTALEAYALSLGQANPEEVVDRTLVMNHAKRAIQAFSLDDFAEARLGVHSFSRTVSDVFSVQPPEYQELSSALRKISRYIDDKTQ